MDRIPNASKFNSNFQGNAYGQSQDAAERRGLLRKTVFDRGALGLRIEHLIFRLLRPKFPRLSGTILLLVDPVAYEMLPNLRLGTALTIRQKLGQQIAKLLVTELIDCRQQLLKARCLSTVSLAVEMRHKQPSEW